MLNQDESEPGLLYNASYTAYRYQPFTATKEEGSWIGELFFSFTLILFYLVS